VALLALGAAYLQVHFVQGLRKKEHLGRATLYESRSISTAGDGVIWELIGFAPPIGLFALLFEPTTCCIAPRGALKSYRWSTGNPIQQLSAGSYVYGGPLFYAGSAVADLVSNPLLYGYKYVIDTVDVRKGVASNPDQLQNSTCCLTNYLPAVPGTARYDLSLTPIHKQEKHQRDADEFREFIETSQECPFSNKTR
jgi:hypothetical protein